MSDLNLAHAVAHFADITHRLSDAALDHEWTWRYHDEGVRFAFLGTYHELRDLAVTTADARLRNAAPPTIAQRVLAHYHLAYCDLQSLLLGVSDEDGARVPVEGEWPLHVVLDHMIQTERAFFALIMYAVEHQRKAQDQPLTEMDEAWANTFFADDNEAFDAINDAPLSAIRAYYDTLHDRIMHTLAGLSDQELDALSLWWEEREIPVRFRMHRFDAHMRQHTIQVEKTLALLDLVPSESKRLLRLIYGALAEAEGAALGSTLESSQQWNELAAMISERADEIAGLGLGM